MTFATFSPELMTVVITVQDNELIDELATTADTARVVVLTIANVPAVLTPEEARLLARALTLTAEAAEAG